TPPGTRPAGFLASDPEMPRPLIRGVHSFRHPFPMSRCLVPNGGSAMLPVPRTLPKGSSSNGGSTVRPAPRFRSPSAPAGSTHLVLFLALLFCSALAAVPGVATSAYLFEAGVSFEVGDSPNSVAVGDLNSDGKRDIVTAN